MKTDLALSLMEEFAARTGITDQAAPRRYLWTDAFAVCNFLGLHRRTGDDRHLKLARKLVDQVHHVLGRHRDDDSRRGWISGLSEDVGERHPTAGGLRIGKPLPERRTNEPFDAELEWNRDGQYFHYLTKWIHALCRIGRETGETCYRQWAAELAIAAYRAFTLGGSPGRYPRMVWKMSIDLSRPLVPSMGQHDPLDGLISCLEVQDAEGGGTPHSLGADLNSIAADLTALGEQSDWATDDPLGIGGLLEGAARLAPLVLVSGLDRRDLLHRLMFEAERSLMSIVRTRLLDRAAEQRLAFRELGLSIGLHGIELARELLTQSRDFAPLCKQLLSYQPWAERIDGFWSRSAQRLNTTWHDHQDINTVMLATSLLPEGYFGP